MAMGAGSMAAASGGNAQAQPAAKTFVLVHGAWHGGWCWRRVADALSNKGHKVFAPTLTGLGASSHLLTRDVNLSTHVTDIVNLIAWEDLNNIVLVGHSYGGFVVSGVAETMADRIASIVFLDAFVPDDGISLADTASKLVRDGIVAAQSRGDIGIKGPPAAVFQVNEADRAWVDSKCTLHPVASLTEKARYAGGRDKVARKTYIRASGYPSPAFDAAHDKLRANAAWRTYTIGCGHDVMVDAPERLTEILLEVS